MTKQSSWCRGFISGFWWWLLALLGLPLLFLLMTYFHQSVVEGDISNRVSQALDAEGIDWAEVDLERRGRDVLLKGTPPDESSRTSARDVAQGVYGVNKVDFLVDSGAAPEQPETDDGTQVANDDTTPAQTDAADTETDTADTETESAINMPTLNASLREGKITLQGELPSQAEIDSLVGAAERKFGKENVSNQLVVGEDVDRPDWMVSAGDLLTVLPDKDAMLNVSAEGIELAGEMNSASDKETLITRANNLFGGDVTDNIVVKELLPPQVEMQLANGQLTLSGTVGAQEQADTLARIAVQRAGAGNVVNNLQVSEEYADAAWIGSAQQLFSNLLPEDGSATIADGKVEIEAKVTSEAARDQLLANSNESLQDSGLTLVNNISVVSAEEIQAAQETAADACQEKLDATMKDKNILFRVNRADIRAASHALLDELAAIVTGCNDALAGRQVAIGGHTDSDGAESYNLRLSQRRADAVRSYLVEKGVSGSLLSASGFGESQPVASNATAAGKAQNRRISFEIKAAE